MVFCFFLIKSGDTELQSGPNHITIFYANVHSLYSSNPAIKIDEINTILCQREKCEIVCISETWLNESITDDEVEILSYQICHGDRAQNIN